MRRALSSQAVMVNQHESSLLRVMDHMQQLTASVTQLNDQKAIKDLKDLMRKLDGTDLNGRKLKIFEDRRRSQSKSRSRSRSYSRSRSRSASCRCSRSHSPRSPSRTPERKSSRGSKPADPKLVLSSFISVL
ncbi:unnamed protein product [Merluccius merluccius]